MPNKNIKDFLNNKHSNWKYNFDLFHLQLLSKFAEYYEECEEAFEEAVDVCSNIEDVESVWINIEWTKWESDIKKNIPTYINTFENYLLSTPLSVFMEEYEPDHLIYLMIKIRFKKLLLDNKNLIEEYIQWKSFNDLESDK